MLPHRPDAPELNALAVSRGYFPIEYELAERELSFAALGAMVSLRFASVLLESDGRITKRQAATVPAKLIKELVSAGLIAESDVGYVDVGFLVWGTSRHTMQSKRKAWREKKERQRSGRKSADVPRDVSGDVSGDIPREVPSSPSPSPSAPYSADGGAALNGSAPPRGIGEPPDDGPTAEAIAAEERRRALVVVRSRR